MYNQIINTVIASVSVIILLAIIRYYTRKKFIPTRNNILFYTILRTGFSVCFVNLLSIFSSLLNFSIDVHYITTIIYLCLYEVLYLLVVRYILWNCIPEASWNNSLFLKVLPCVVAVFSALLMWNNDEIFLITSDNTFHLGELYSILIIPPMTMILFSLVIFLIKRLRIMNSRDKGILSGVIVLIAGFFADAVHPDLLFMDFFISFSLVIFYISTESPEHFLSDMAGCYNTRAFDALVNESISEEKTFFIYGFEIQNYDTIRKRCSSASLSRAISDCASWLESWFPDGYVFYTGSTCFNIFTYHEMCDATYRKFLLESKNLSFYSGEESSMYFVSRHIFVDCRDPLCTCSSDILNGENIAIDQASFHNEILRVDHAIYRQIEREKTLHSIIENTLSGDGLKIYLQPICNPQSGRIEGAEVLARILDPVEGLLMPGDFIPLAEKSTMIVTLSYRIFEETCRYLSETDLQTLGIRFININCSPMQFHDLNLADKLKKISDSYDLDFSLFKFEVTESYVTNSEMIRYHIDRFREKGAIIVMDDFGKGGSGLSRLLDFDFDVVKIDMSLIWSYFSGKSSMIENIIPMFKKENLKVVAEGIETSDMIEPLMQMGCDYLQGYYFSRPLPADAFERFTVAYNTPL